MRISMYDYGLQKLFFSFFYLLEVENKKKFV